MKRIIYLICLFFSFFMLIINVKAIEYVNNVFTVSLEGNNVINNNNEVIVKINVDVRYDLSSIIGDIIFNKNKLKLTKCESDIFVCTYNDKLLLDSTDGIKGKKTVAILTFEVLDDFKNGDDVLIEFKNIEGYNNTAGNNSKITIHKVQNDTSLSTLIVENENLIPEFTSSNTTYRVTTTEEYINIKATSNSNITGIGKKKLDYGNNILKVKVTAETGDIREYVINVFREQVVVENNSDSNSNNSSANSSNKTNNNKNSSNNNEKSNSNTNSNNSVKTKSLSSNKKLKFLKIEGVNFGFKENVLEYNIDVDSGIENLNIDYELEDSKSRIVISGDTKFTGKDNLVIISVIAEDGSQIDYKIHVNKKDNDDTVTSVVEIPKKEIANDTKKENKKGNNMLKWLLIGIGIVVFIVLIFKVIKLVIINKNKG